MPIARHRSAKRGDAQDRTISRRCAGIGKQRPTRLVDLLLDRGKLIVSLVAEAGDDLLGHIAFSRVSMASCPESRGVGLGPMAVLPAIQRQGIGSALVRASLE